jgi:hypothetical protein
MPLGAGARPVTRFAGGIAGVGVAWLSLPGNGISAVENAGNVIGTGSDDVVLVAVSASGPPDEDEPSALPY